MMVSPLPDPFPRGQDTEAEALLETPTTATRAGQLTAALNSSRHHRHPLPKLALPAPTLRHASPATTSPSPTSSTSQSSPASNSSTPPGQLPKSYQLSRSSQWIIAALILFSSLAIAAMVDSFLHHQRDRDSCKQSYMRPSYIRQAGFDSEMTRFAGKYNLYLYREKGIDPRDQLLGIPVLFIPGHAGSYKQVKSVAAEAAYYYHQYYAVNRTLREQGMRGLDFFTVDFHEEFSALHGQSLLEQAEYLNDAIDYILKLYPLSRKTGPRMNAKLPDPSAVVVLGHSMGGVVARALFMLHNYQPGTVNTVITLSTPHLLPPAPFDAQVTKLYDDLQRFWSNGYANPWETRISRSPVASLKDVTLISVTGGTLDNVICSDLANVGAFLPPTHGFTVFTSSVPDVWTATDHLSILTCKQIVRVLAKSMLAIVDARRSQQTKTVEDRMRILKNIYLGGLDSRIGDGSDIDLGNAVTLDVTQNHIQILKAGERLRLTSNITPTTFLVPKTSDGDAFAILSDQMFGGVGRFDLQLCRGGAPDAYNQSDLVCREANTMVTPLPTSLTTSSTDPFQRPTLSYASILFREMQEHEWLAVTDRGGTRGFLVVEAYNTVANTHIIHAPMRGIVLKGVHVNVKPGLLSTIQIPAIESAMLAYRMRVSRPGCASLFTPLLRQSIATMHESKFYVNLADDSETEIALHGRAAFWPQDQKLYGTEHQGLRFQVWMDPSCNQPLSLDLSVDWYGSAGRIGFRHGIMLAAYPFVIILLVIATQIQCYNQNGIYPHFAQGLSHCMRSTWPGLITLLAVSSIYQCFAQRTYTLNDMFHVEVSIAWHEVLAGNTDRFFWWLPVVGLVISIGVVCMVWLLVEVVLHVLATVSACLGRYLTWRRWCCYSRSGETGGQPFQRRAITTLVLFALVATCIPYQFVFVVAFLVHVINCARALEKIWMSPLTDYKALNRYHFMQSLLVLFVTLLPFTLPMLVVWARNLSVHWFVPFSSDHNVFAVAPIILYVELLTSGQYMLPKTQHVWSGITSLLIYGMVVHAFLYGIKYTHTLYFLSNYFITWLLVLHGRNASFVRTVCQFVAEHLYPFQNKKHS